MDSAVFDDASIVDSCTGDPTLDTLRADATAKPGNPESDAESEAAAAAWATSDAIKEGCDGLNESLLTPNEASNGREKCLESDGPTAASGSKFAAPLAAVGDAKVTSVAEGDDGCDSKVGVAQGSPLLDARPNENRLGENITEVAGEVPAVALAVPLKRDARSTLEVTLAGVPAEERESAMDDGELSSLLDALRGELFENTVDAGEATDGVAEVRGSLSDEVGVTSNKEQGGLGVPDDIDR
ncbi:uncharacterized protein BcabD6B2_53570 [Babesia caballi]|uniref:Uncharacterized protein n=1 Tax=Babesia caballi TaxID=5871 RepID=A0AAV4M1Y1_BABCB|nr:hypothetical protein, conserved [Babesia caballi]